MKDKFRNVYGNRVPHTVDKLLCSNSEHLYFYRNIFTFRHFAVVIVVTVLLSSLRQKMSRKQTPQLKKSELSFVLPIDWAGQWILIQRYSTHLLCTLPYEQGQPSVEHGDVLVILPTTSHHIELD